GLAGLRACGLAGLRACGSYYTQNRVVCLAYKTAKLTLPYQISVQKSQVRLYTGKIYPIRCADAPLFYQNRLLSLDNDPPSKEFIGRNTIKITAPEVRGTQLKRN
ncbi:MAG: hypothetical protein LBD45_00345, partial [Bacteroidales bacterium]|nr:hypothetical protein [Bacteroidales bacterium]